MAAATPNTSKLARSDVFAFVGPDDATFQDRLDLSHKRAMAVAKAYALTADDVLTCSEKFWNMNIDKTCTLDGAAFALLGIQYNLAGGTLATFIRDRPDLQHIMEDAMAFRVAIHFMLTELGHGLDVSNLETTATLLPTGEFDLHTPHDNAAKYMPPSNPAGGVPRIAVVFARLMVDGQDRGIRPFLTPINDGKSMCKGITSRPLPNRCGAKTVGFCITHFNHVRLPASSLLGKLEPSTNRRIDFLADIWRVGVGSIVLTASAISGLKIAAYIVAEYSKRRMITNPTGKKVTLITFRTQHSPIFRAISYAWVLEAFYRNLRKHFASPNSREIIKENLNLRNAVSTVFKTVMVNLWRECSIALTDRCGAQGLFEHNQLIPSEMEMRGVTTAEGDILVLSIRLASELLLGRYEMPAATNPQECPLSLHEEGIFNELRGLFFTLDGKHRTEQFSRRILPRCMELTEAIGLRMAHDAAREANVDPALLDLFEVQAMKRDLAWYISQKVISSRQELLDREDAIITTLEPRLDQLLVESGAKPYAFAAITSPAGWEKFYRSLPVLQGNAIVDMLPQGDVAQTFEPYNIGDDVVHLSRARL